MFEEREILPLIADVACKAPQMINVILSTHNEFKGRDVFVASGTGSRQAEKSQVISKT